MKPILRCVTGISPVFLMAWLSLSSPVCSEPLEVRLTQDRADSKFGMNRPMLAYTKDGRKMVAKLNSPNEIGGEVARRRDLNSVLASQLLVALGMPCIPSYEARWKTEDGWAEGSVSEWLDGAMTLVEFPPSRISNPEEAVATLIWREFLGDGDINATNFLVQVENGKLVAIDLDKAFLGVFPRKSSAFSEVMSLYANPQTVNPVLAEIQGMDEKRIGELLDQVGPKALEEWSVELRGEVLENLLSNREKLLRENRYSQYYGLKIPPWFFPEKFRVSEGDSRVRD